MKQTRRSRALRRRGRAAGVVLAGGSGTRVGAGINKAFLPLAGRSIASWGINTLGAVQGVGILVFVVRPEDLEHARFVAARETDRPLEIIPGGETRQDSELMALRHLADRIDAGTIDTVLIHDAARPLVSHGLASAVLHAAREHGGAVPGIPVTGIAPVQGADGLAPGDPRTLDALLRVQTPQGFHAATILDAYEAAARDGFVGTDTASCAEEYTAAPVTWVRGEETNFKITYAQDLLLAQDVVTALGLRTG
ncbi:IspD/TarI family cytidylyltransferase [Brachybacterium alimentarium]|uniref:2-C-methyl-D-erythritol 4-phosphate cytidylyltransferase n=1 Tax=Brachybacterium alimentarium TaxID=47845 RepID=A0A2A3YLK4_9MICO|nr:IspD/TarI family cytidylyltransferase [Brachybacterium alimentarium]PCC34809.1 2-C-methyl-D-erythritol 4-phosphate cytidylyltransferase [Brachybacterium alimentarium]PCC40187.1 2-C-methyl-D-erythritol 4-phosphate cytidylyltransferase [Brachybacterium alimentarium]RCS69029.1 2-C-methyl-D-erythritol 4-phosphate cytidylyltransferase [Brachybacterium alimentarium]RCS80547.1 2-C-methyl-D-erythritol 4-phosphate cytidylyltransferase [Brachybacterium alimentarium]RCS82851.1 2-C-methyl-D-erythritol 